MCLVVVPVVSFFLPLSGDKKIHAKISIYTQRDAQLEEGNKQAK